MRSTRSRLGLVFAVAMVASLSPVGPQVAQADHGQPALDPSKIDYTPIGYYGPADEAGTPVGESPTIPIPQAGPPGPPPNGINDPNPSGKWVSYDTNVWESLALPSRHPGDNCNSLSAEEQESCEAGDLDPDNDAPAGYTGPGGVSTVHGRCPPSQGFIAGECFNSQLEWLDYFEASMEEMLGDFGVVVHRYPFHSPGRSDMGTGRGGYLDAAGGQAYNISATVPGTDHPEETVLVSGHYDFTDSGPAAAWDSAEGHTEVMRMAYIMSNYWRETGTRPSATVKFIPWDSEESGTFGSLDYVQNNIPPGEEDKVRGYFNVDPCAGAYPAFYHGNPALGRIPQVMQLANPAALPEGSPERARIEAFNARAEGIVDEVFDNLDDTITVGATEHPIFVSDSEAQQMGVDSQRDEIVTAVGGLLIFSSDYANFEDVGIPIFNLFPDVFGPHADGTPASSEGISILHTERDNLTTINALTNADQSGLTASEGWAKGMEMCAQIEAWYMLQPEMGGTQTATDAPVAYYEALPNEAIPNQDVTFDASGSYQYANPATRELVPAGNLSYSWDFGDGTTGNGRVVDHAYAEIGRYTTTLTVTGVGGATDTMTLPVEVVPSDLTPPSLADIDDDDAEDGDFQLNWDFDGSTDGFEHFSVEESSDLQTIFSDDAEGAIADNWTVEVTGEAGHVDRTEPWQESDSTTPKFRGNQSHSGTQSWWAGVTPSNFPNPPLNTNSILTSKDPISIPEEGDAEITFWSLYQNEGDEQGRVEVAVDDGDPATEPEWETIHVIQPGPTFLGDPHEPLICSPNEPETLVEDFRHERARLTRYQGKDVLVRFVYRSGPENRTTSQPCGWYVDDIRVTSGSWSEIGTPTQSPFQVTGRATGTYAYRVTAVYVDDITSAPSNVEVAEVTGGEPPKECPGHEGQAGNHVVGTSKGETLKGTAGRDIICAKRGNDTLKGLGGNDLLLGGAGNDTARGGKGADDAKGGTGKDTLLGKKGGDELLGQKGNDTLKGQKGPDVLKGGAGNDTCTGGPGKDEEKGCEN